MRVYERRNRVRKPALHRLRICARVYCSAILICAGVSHAENAPPRFDYPTAVRADYVIGCIAANGFQHAFLDQCACEIDVIANRLSYDDYEQASTILSMQQASIGPRGGLFRDTPVAKQSLEKLRRAEAEASLRC